MITFRLPPEHAANHFRIGCPGMGLLEGMNYLSYF